MWEELGIPPTDDRKEIQRAYARRLRSFDPDADPAAFQRLRQSYESALARAAYLKKQVEAGAPPPEQVPAEPAPLEHVALERTEPSSPPRGEARYPDSLSQPPLPQPSAAQRHQATLINPGSSPISEAELEREAIGAKIDEALKARNYDQALAQYDSGMARGAFPLGYRERLVERIMRVVLRDTDLSSDRFLKVAAHVGWQSAPGRGEYISPVRQAAMQRLQAESWFKALKEKAEGRAPRQALPKWDIRKRLRAFFLRDLERRNARIFLGHHRFTVTSAVRAASMQNMVREYRHYGSFLKDRIKPKDGERAERIARRENFWYSPPNLLRVAVWTIYLVFGAVIMNAIGIESPLPFMLPVAAFWGLRAGYNRLMRSS
ncbi:MAG TPA: hypothetical protein VGG48_05110 [Rhizomicrobium sp.]|jgi:hypothetical protein